MKPKYKTIIAIIAIIAWLFLIYYLSNMNTHESNSKSIGVINNIVEKVLNTTYNLGITSQKPDKNYINTIATKLNYPLRKIMHMSVYFILCLLIIILIPNIHKSPTNPLKITILAISLCFIYAITDEYHQTHIIGRTGQLTDVLIDTSGAIIAGTIYITRFAIKNYK